MGLLLLGMGKREERGELVLWSAVVVLALTAFLVGSESGTVTAFGDSFIVDPFARTMKILTLIGAGTALIMSRDYWIAEDRLKFEFPVLVLLAATGMMMMISANDLITL